MRTRTNDFKNNIKEFGRELDTVITYVLNGETEELSMEDLSSVSLHYEANILKSVMRQLDFTSKIDIPLGTKLDTVLFGVKVRNNNVQNYRDNYDYVDFGNFYVYSSEKQEATNDYKIVCYDKMLNAMKDYIGINTDFPMTVNDFIDNVCRQIGVGFASYNDSYANKNKILDSDMFIGANFTYRDVLDNIAEVTASIVCINDNDDLEIRYPVTTNDTIDETYLKDTNVNFNKKYGPINSIVLSRAAESDNVYLKDDESIELNGLCEIKITDNQIMNFNNRSEYLPDILEKLDGLEYYLADYESVGIAYYDVGDLYNVTIGENTYNCLFLSDDINITQGLSEHVYCDESKKAQTDYKKADKTDQRINETWLIVNKQQGTIEGLASKVTDVEDNLGNVYTKQEVNDFISSAEQGFTNTFSEAGGANMLRNTTFSSNEVLEQGQVYEYWFGNVVRTTNTSSANGFSILLQNDTLYQTQKIANGPYTLSFYYKKLNPLATVKVIINDKEYELTRAYNTLFQTGQGDIDPINITSNSITVEFVSDLDNSCEIYDIMLNSGSIKLAYSQNPNEIITNTVNIQKGITITSSTSEVKFTANNDGIRTKTLRDDVITEFTDKGMTTKEATITDKATIVGILRQQVGDQIWDSMI